MSTKPVEKRLSKNLYASQAVPDEKLGLVNELVINQTDGQFPFGNIFDLVEQVSSLEEVSDIMATNPHKRFSIMQDNDQFYVGVYGTVKVTLSEKTTDKLVNFFKKA